jgi:formyltetrahydrofolate-dependent phosphoribosylglycinamide formyltransferase
MSTAGNKPRVAVLISGSGSNLQSLIDAAHAPNYPAEIALVLSNVATAYGIERANKAGIPVKVISHHDFADRSSFEAALAASLAEFKIEYVCLAGFMRILTADFVRLWAGRMLNIHPSLLPAFKGRNVHAQALAAGVTISGCTVHLVTPELDDGPIIVQAAVPVLPDDDEAHLAKRILAEEHRIYPQALAWLASGRINVADDDKTAQARARLGSLINPPV